MCQPARIPCRNKNWMAAAQRHKIMNYYVSTKHNTIVLHIPELSSNVLFRIYKSPAYIRLQMSALKMHFNGFNNTYHCNMIFYSHLFLFYPNVDNFFWCWVSWIQPLSAFCLTTDLELNIKMKLAAFCTKTVK